MKIAVCVKFIQGEINPFDACALECALRWKGAEITVVSMGPEHYRNSLEVLTRLGSFRAILISDPLYVGSDTVATSYILSLCLKKIEPDLIFCGRQSIDGDTAQTGPCLATRLNFNLIPQVLEFETEEKFEAKKKIGAVERICRTREGERNIVIPSLLTIERINTLRFPSLRARIRPVEVWDNTQIGAVPARCGISGSPTHVLSIFEAEQGRRHCQFIQRNELDELIERLRKERKSIDNDNINNNNIDNEVINNINTNIVKQLSNGTERLKEIVVIGKELEALARTLAEKVIVLEKGSISEIVAWAQEHQPEVILWSADSWGRNTAPQVAIHLQTGLCADCTHLAVEGGRLMMYRPARGASILAKIECRSLPQMATVRIAHRSSEIMISCGRGVASELERVGHYAEAIGAEMGASRGLVDSGLMPYEYQVGLTGRTVSPKIYIATGISGAVHHTSAIESAQYIIAINPDRNARIFDYADYGIVDKF